jgi:pimeloyl-ACP methyl ester carboxylesterase
MFVRRAPAPVFSALLRGSSLAARAAGGQRIARALGLLGPKTLAHDAERIVDHLRRLDAGTVQIMIASAQDHDAWDLLPHIEVPVLIIASDDDRFAPARTVGAMMHARCPQSELVRIPGAAHTALIDHADAIGEAVDDFLSRRVKNE